MGKIATTYDEHVDGKTARETAIIMIGQADRKACIWRAERRIAAGEHVTFWQTVKLILTTGVEAWS